MYMVAKLPMIYSLYPQYNYIIYIHYIYDIIILCQLKAFGIYHRLGGSWLLGLCASIFPF